MLERERKFRVYRAYTGPTELEHMADITSDITQVYLSVKPEARVRRTQDRKNRFRGPSTTYTLTTKGEGVVDRDGALQRTELEVMLPNAMGEQLLTTFADRPRVTKTRYTVDGRYRGEVGYKMELDLFGGPLTGLMLLEIEEPAGLPDVIEEIAFGHVRLEVREVTNEPLYKNAILARTDESTASLIYGELDGAVFVPRVELF
jgi:CYTH domain-containing protein